MPGKAGLSVFFGVFALLGGADAHVTAVCTAVSPLQPSVVTMFIGTYHSLPAAGSLTPGEFNFVPPDGTRYQRSFAGFCAAGGVNSTANLDAYVNSLRTAAPSTTLSAKACSTMVRGPRRAWLCARPPPPRRARGH